MTPIDDWCSVVPPRTIACENNSIHYNKVAVFLSLKASESYLPAKKFFRVFQEFTIKYLRSDRSPWR
jgi:hypothetical protein